MADSGQQRANKLAEREARRCWKSPTLAHASDGDGFCTWCGAALDATGAAGDSHDPAQLDILGGDAA